MFRCGRMEFELARKENGDLRLMVRGSSRYKRVITQAFSSLKFSRDFIDRFGRYDWGIFINQASDADESNLRDFCILLQHTVFIEDDLDEDFALSFHTQYAPGGRYERTQIGELVYQANPYNLTTNIGSLEKAKELAATMADFVLAHPSYVRAECLAAVPPSNPNKQFDLPTYLVQEIARLTGRPVATASIRKTRATRPMKDCRTDEEKAENIKGAFVADASTFKGKSVILVDDIYETGASINEVYRALRAAGASPVFGLVATKTSANLR